MSGMRKDWSKFSTSLLIEMLDKSNGSIMKCDLICELVARNYHGTSFENALENLSESEQVFWNNYKVSDFADAARHIMGFESYLGERQETRTLIESKLNFA